MAAVFSEFMMELILLPFDSDMGAGYAATPIVGLHGSSPLDCAKNISCFQSAVKDGLCGFLVCLYLGFFIYGHNPQTYKNITKGERKLKRKTYNNVLKVMKMIMKKGYDKEESARMAVKIFDERENDVVPIEFYINKLATKEEWLKDQAEYGLAHKKEWSE